MRKHVVAAVVCLAVLGGIAQAQMRGMGGGARGGFAFSGVRQGVTPGTRGMAAPFFRGHHVFGQFGRFPGVCTPFAGCFRPAVFGVPFNGVHFGHRGSTFFGGSFGFGAGIPAWGGLGGYGYGYGMPYYIADGGYDQEENVQQQAADRQRAMDEMNFERRRDMELQRQVAELQAAQEASDRAAQQRAAQPMPVRSAPEAQPLPAVLVFRDGRQMQVENYVITSERLFTLGPDQHRTIQLSDLDLNATVKANQERGVSFSVPKAGAGK